MLWNEPNNLSHWDFQMDPEWRIFGTMIKEAAQAIGSESNAPRRVLGGISPIDPGFMRNMQEQGVLDHLEAVAVHGFPLDWNHWTINEWPSKIDEIRAVTKLPVWVSEVGVSTFGAEEVQEFGLASHGGTANGSSRANSLVQPLRFAPCVACDHAPSRSGRLFVLSALLYGLLREDGTPKLALKQFHNYTPEFGICQWFHFEDHRLDSAVRWLRNLGVTRLRTGLSWSDSLRPGAEDWFDRMMRALDDFDLTVTFCFTPNSRGLRPDHTSPPQEPAEFADFCAAMVRRYCGAGSLRPLAL